MCLQPDPSTCILWLVSGRAGADTPLNLGPFPSNIQTTCPQCDTTRAQDPPLPVTPALASRPQAIAATPWRSAWTPPELYGRGPLTATRAVAARPPGFQGLVWSFGGCVGVVCVGAFPVSDSDVAFLSLFPSQAVTP